MALLHRRILPRPHKKARTAPLKRQADSRNPLLQLRPNARSPYTRAAQTPAANNTAASPHVGPSHQSHLTNPQRPHPKAGPPQHRHPHFELSNIGTLANNRRQPRPATPRTNPRTAPHRPTPNHRPLSITNRHIRGPRLTHRPVINPRTAAQRPTNQDQNGRSTARPHRSPPCKSDARPARPPFCKSVACRRPPTLQIRRPLPRAVNAGIAPSFENRQRCVTFQPYADLRELPPSRRGPQLACSTMPPVR